MPLRLLRVLLDDLERVRLAVLARAEFAAALATVLPTFLIADLAVLSLAQLRPSFAADRGTALLNATASALALAAKRFAAACALLSCVFLVLALKLDMLFEVA